MKKVVHQPLGQAHHKDESLHVPSTSQIHQCTSFAHHHMKSQEDSTDCYNCPDVAKSPSSFALCLLYYILYISNTEPRRLAGDMKSCNLLFCFFSSEAGFPKGGKCATILTNLQTIFKMKLLIRYYFHGHLKGQLAYETHFYYCLECDYWIL